MTIQGEHIEPVLDPLLRIWLFVYNNLSQRDTSINPPHIQFEILAEIYCFHVLPHNLTSNTNYHLNIRAHADVLPLFCHVDQSVFTVSVSRQPFKVNLEQINLFVNFPSHWNLFVPLRKHTCNQPTIHMFSFLLTACEVASVLLKYVSSRQQQLQSDSSWLNWHTVIAFIIISLSPQSTNGYSSFTVNFCNPSDNSNNVYLEFLKLIQQLSCSILWKQNAVFSHQMIPLSLTVAFGPKRRSQIPY